MGSLKRSEKMLIGAMIFIVLIAGFMLLSPSGSAAKKNLLPLAQAEQKEADTQVKIRMLTKAGKQLNLASRATSIINRRKNYCL